MEMHLCVETMVNLRSWLQVAGVPPSLTAGHSLVYLVRLIEPRAHHGVILGSLQIDIEGNIALALKVHIESHRRFI